VVRRLASLLDGPAGLVVAFTLALAYFLIAGELPGLGDGDTATLVAGLVGVGVIAGVVLTVVHNGDAVTPVALLALSTAILVGAMDASGAHASVSAMEAVLAGCLGIIIGHLLAAPVVALAIPVFVAIVDAWSVANGPSSRLSEGHPRGAAELTFDIPSWGGTPGASSRLGLVDAIFLAMFAVWARRFGLRPVATAIGMTTGLLAAVVLSVALDRAIPALPLMAVGYWLPNVDRFAAMFRHPHQG
jgi:hypothetical protein